MKILVLGDAGVGKTSLIRRLATNKFDKSYLLTVGMDPSAIELTLPVDEIQHNGTKIKLPNPFPLQIWDIAGQKQFQVFRQVFYRGANAALIVFDLTRHNTLTELDKWVYEYQKHCLGAPFIFVGNKSDLKDLVGIEDTEIEEFSRKQHAMFWTKTSAFSGENVLDAFRNLVFAVIKTSNK